MTSPNARVWYSRERLVTVGLPEYLDERRLSAAFYVKDEVKEGEEHTVATISWGPYFIEIVVTDGLSMIERSSGRIITTTADLEREGITTDKLLEQAFDDRLVDTYSMPVLRLQCEGLVGYPNLRGFYRTVDAAWIDAEQTVRDYLSNPTDNDCPF
jgi:hypothetical protein